MRVCDICHSSFEEKRYNSKYCNKNCKKVAQKRHYVKWCANNIEHVREQRRSYYHSKDKERIAIKQKQFRKTDAGRQRRNDDQKKRETRDPLFKLRRRMRNRLWKLNKNNELSITLSNSLGCSQDVFKLYIENLFYDDPVTGIAMSWDRYGKQTETMDPKWEIDHIVPLGSADSAVELVNLNHFSNLRPLWAKDNHDKSYSDKHLIIKNRLATVSVKD